MIDYLRWICANVKIRAWEIGGGSILIGVFARARLIRRKLRTVWIWPKKEGAERGEKKVLSNENGITQGQNQ